MKIGILNGLIDAEEQVDWGGTPVDTYIRFLESGGGGFTYQGYDIHRGQFPADIDACDAYLVTGSERGAYDQDPWIGRLSQFLRDCFAAGKKLVGICFGHQILAHALGGRTEKSAKGWGLGLRRFDLHDSAPWMNGAGQSCALYFVHQDQVVSLPPGARLLGGDAFCPNACFAIGSQVFGIQGHPEFTAAIMDDILAGKDGDVDQALRLAAVESLRTADPDNTAVARWVVRFLNT